MKKTLTIAGVAALIIAAPLAAFAAGSDAPTPYQVTAEGITLPAGQTFQDNGHVNVRTNQGNRGIHFESLNNQTSGQWIGKSFLPWSAFGFDTASVCVSWIQISQFNEHFGEGGQSSVGNGCVVATPEPTPTPTPEPTETPEPSPTPTAEPTPEPSETPEPTPTATVPATTPPGNPEPTPSASETPVVSPTPTSEPTEPVTAKRLADTGFDGDTLGNLIVGGLLLAVVGGSLVLWRKGDNA